MNVHPGWFADKDPLRHANSGPLANYFEQLSLHSGGAHIGGGAAQTAPASALVFGDIATMASYLIGGYWAWSGYPNGDTLPRHWATNTISVNITGLDPTEQGYATSALGVWHDVANLNFVFTTGAADITFNHDLQNNQQYAATAMTVSGLYITSATVDISSGWAPRVGMDNYMYQSYIHEIGHALGLGHQGPYNENATYGVDNIFANDTWQWSIMSYFHQDKYGGGTYTYLTTPQMVDIYAIQQLYGANSSTRLADTTYGFHSNAGALYDFTKYTYTPTFTIYDSGGNDTFDCSGDSLNQTINLNPGTWSSVDGGVNNVGIYITTLIENAIGGSGNDTIIGNAVANRIDGGAGSNVLTGGGGADNFVFDTGLHATFDRITDFAPQVDKLMLAHHAFGALNAAGHGLAAAMFHEGSTFTTARQRIDYNPHNGWLIYDTNGHNPGGHPTHFMTLSAHLNLHNTDFAMIA